MCNRLDGQVRHSPQPEQIRADLGVRNPQQFLLGFELLAFALGGQRDRGAKFVGHFAGEDQSSNIVEERGHHRGVASLLLQRKSNDDGGRNLSMLLDGLADRWWNTRVRNKNSKSLSSQG